MLLRHTGTCTTGKTVDFLGRRITNKGDHFFEISLNDSYTNDILQEANLLKTTPAVTPGATTSTPTPAQDELLDKQEHGRKLGRLSRYTKEHNRFRDPTLGYNSALWIPYTSSRSTLISRE